MSRTDVYSRRHALKLALATGALASAPGLSSRALAGGTINFADIGVGDPGGDWSRYTKTSGYNVNLVSIGNAPSAILNVLIAGAARAPTTSLTSLVACRSLSLTATSSRSLTLRRYLTGPEQEYCRVPGAWLTRIQLHRLQWQNLWLSHRSAGRQLRLPAGKNRTARFLRRAV